MTEFLAFLFGAIILCEGLVIWILKSANDQMKGAITRLNRENADLARSLKVTRSRMK